MSKKKHTNKTPKVNWTPSSKQWVKQYKGKKYYLGQGKNKSDRESYHRAVKKFEEIKNQVDSGGEVLSTKEILPEKPKSKKKKSSRPWNPRRVKTVVKRFLDDKRRIAVSNPDELTLGRVQNLKNRLQHFVDHFENELLSRVTANELNRWVKKSAKRVEKGEIAPATLRQDHLAVKQLFKYAYEEEIINSTPRNLDKLTKRSKRSAKASTRTRRDKHFSKQEIQLLYQSCNVDHMDSKWLNRGDTHIEMMQLAIVLALNTGMTQEDLNDLTVGDIYLNKRPPRCIRQRTKTLVDANHLLWRESVRLLKPHMTGKKMNDLILLRKDGRPLITQSTNNRGVLTGGRSDVLGACFTRLVKRVLGKDEDKRFRDLRRTGANMCGQRFPGMDETYLAHAERKASSYYSLPAQRQFDTMLTYLEKDLGFSKDLMKLPKGKTK